MNVEKILAVANATASTVAGRTGLAATCEAVELDTLRWTIINHDEWVQVPAVLTFGPNGMSDRPAGARK